ncbi:MAG: hypothetical protein AAFM92_03185 [Pseudomonadota bacterium]
MITFTNTSGSPLTIKIEGKRKTVLPGGAIKIGGENLAQSGVKAFRKSGALMAEAQAATKAKAEAEAQAATKAKAEAAKKDAKGG